MRGKRLGAIAFTGLFAVSSLGQETRTSVDPNGQAITVAGDQSVQSPPVSGIRNVQRPIGLGGVIAIPEFVGDRQEGWETQCPCDPPFFPCVPNERMFQDIADMCANSAHLTGGWGFRCSISRRSGSWLYGSTGSESTVTFDDGWEALRFGGYFGTNAGEGDDADIEFYDINDDLIDLLVADIPADCSWNWNGWESTIPIKRIVITGNNPFGGGFIMMDDMEYSRTPQDPGACCTPDGSCTDDVPPSECAQNGGRFEGNTLCKDLDPPCSEQTGGCCIEAGGGCQQSCERECDGDVDCDGFVNPVDFGLCQAAMGSDDPQDLCDFDMDCDGVINPVDCGLIQTLFGTCEEPRGTCDDGGGAECAVITGTECRERGGSFLGFGTDCEDDPCGFAEGACCLELDCSGTTRRAECDDRGGAWFRGQTCPEFECPDVLACGWDNGMIPNGFSGRALSPPNFPDIRVVDDIVAERPGCTVLNFHANVIEDAGWTEDGVITVFVYADTGSGPGALIASVDSGYTRMATGDSYFGREDFDYWVEGISIDLPVGVSWIGIRNAGGGGAGTNYWMTSDGGADGPGSDTGWFSLDAGSNFSAEGAGWHHAFEVVP